MKFKLLSLMVGTIAVAGAIVGCETTTTNTNSNIRNANSNTAIVVNSNANMNANSNRWNSNVNRADYDKNRAEYEREKGSSTIGQGANDSWLWFKTRAALLTTSDLRESTINVDAVNDVITLRGTVETAAQKTKAEQVAKGIEGVKSVKNELKVAPDDSIANVSGNSSNTNRR